MALRLLALLAVLAALLFLPAGRWNWPQAWAFLLAYGAFLALYAGWGLWRDPAQLAERSRVAPNVKTWDKVILTAYTLCLLLTFVLAGLDAGRFHWSSVALPIEALAWLGQALAGSVIFWAVATNTYLSRLARIQDDRGQVVITSGPYHHVRHPMYVGIIVLFVCVPLALGSWWALLPGAGIAVLFVVRTWQEDEMLRAELAGYEAYTRRVRYRLFPGVW
jgi:protein-S-isoprenylcysteine O-methyltransferase Ste14